MAELTAKGRRMVKAFASPKGTGDKSKRNMYPIDTIERARNALARLAQYGSPEEKERVRNAVFKKYPGLKGGENDKKERFKKLMKSNGT